MLFPSSTPPSRRASTVLGGETRLEQKYEPTYTAWKNNPTPQITTDLLNTVQPVIDKALTSYGSRDPSPNLRSQAKQMTLRALETYDPAKAKLQTHLMNHLKGLHRQAQRERQILSVPEQVALDNQHLFRSEVELRDKLGREPSDQEIADNTGLSLQRLEYIRQSPRMSMSEGTFAAQAEQLESGPMAPAVKQDDPTGWLEFVYNDLNEVDKAIMEYTLGLHGSPRLPTTEIAQRLNVSPAAISQRAQRIQQKLNQREELGLGL
jgi:DNA-directed RNA polymerase specialized sigma subunit